MAAAAVNDWQRQVVLESLGFKLTKVFLIGQGDTRTFVRTRGEIDDFIRRQFERVYGTDAKVVEVAE